MDLGPSKENIFHNFRTFFDLVICTSKDVKKTVYLEIRNYLLIIKLLIILLLFYLFTKLEKGLHLAEWPR